MDNLEGIKRTKTIETEKKENIFEQNNKENETLKRSLSLNFNQANESKTEERNSLKSIPKEKIGDTQMHKALIRPLAEEETVKRSRSAVKSDLKRLDRKFRSYMNRNENIYMDSVTSTLRIYRMLAASGNLINEADGYSLINLTDTSVKSDYGNVMKALNLVKNKLRVDLSRLNEEVTIDIRKSGLTEEEIDEYKKISEKRIKFASALKDVTIGDVEEKITFNKSEEKKGLSEAQIAGIKACDEWVIRNSTNGVPQSFTDKILQLSLNEKLKLYFIVSNCKNSVPNSADGLLIAKYVPSLKNLKDSMVASKFKFWRRYRKLKLTNDKGVSVGWGNNGNEIYWNKMETAYKNITKLTPIELGEDSDKYFDEKQNDDKQKLEDKNNEIKTLKAGPEDDDSKDKIKRLEKEVHDINSQMEVDKSARAMINKLKEYPEVAKESNKKSLEKYNKELMELLKDFSEKKDAYISAEWYRLANIQTATQNFRKPFFDYYRIPKSTVSFMSKVKPEDKILYKSIASYMSLPNIIFSIADAFYSWRDMAKDAGKVNVLSTTSQVFNAAFMTDSVVDSVTSLVGDFASGFYKVGKNAGLADKIDKVGIINGHVLTGLCWGKNATTLVANSMMHHSLNSAQKKLEENGKKLDLKRSDTLEQKLLRLSRRNIKRKWVKLALDSASSVAINVATYSTVGMVGILKPLIKGLSPFFAKHFMDFYMTNRATTISDFFGIKDSIVDEDKKQAGDTGKKKSSKEIAKEKMFWANEISGVYGFASRTGMVGRILKEYAQELRKILFPVNGDIKTHRKKVEVYTKIVQSFGCIVEFNTDINKCRPTEELLIKKMKG